MKEQEILEGNRLIAEFMKLAKCTDPLHKENPCYYVQGKGYITDYLEFQYHTSWDWSHEAWYKFKNLKVDGVRIPIHANYVARLAHLIAYGTIEEFHIQLTSAIKWYNTQSLPIPQ